MMIPDLEVLADNEGKEQGHSTGLEQELEMEC